MAIGDGSWVTPRTILGAVGATLLDGTPWLAQPPRIGVVSNFSAGPPDTGDVLWDNGQFDTGLVMTSGTTAVVIELDEAQPASVTALSGKVVRRVSGNQSGEYIGVPVLIAGMFLEDDDEEATDFVVVKTLGPAHSYWAALVSDVEVVAGL